MTPDTQDPFVEYDELDPTTHEVRCTGQAFLSVLLRVTRAGNGLFRLKETGTTLVVEDEQLSLPFGEPDAAV